MKILYVITSSDLGGAQRHLLYLVNWFHDHHYDIHVVSGEHGPLIEELERNGIQTTVIPIPKQINVLRDIKSFKKIRSLIVREKFNIVHCHSSKAGIIGRFAAFSAGVSKIVFTAHGFVFTDPSLTKKKRGFYILLEKICTIFSTDIITVSSFDYQQGGLYGIETKKMHIIQNGIPEEIMISEAEWQKKNQVLRESKKFIVGLVGRLVAEKNIDMFIRIARIFKRESDLAVEFWIIGDGPLRSKYEKQVKYLDLGNFVFFKGNQENVVSWLDQMHVQIITSQKEGLPFVLLEGLARGLPIISTDVGGVKEVLDPVNERGVIVELNDDRSMYNRVSALLKNDSKRVEMGRNSIEISQLYTVDTMCDKTNIIYRN